MRVRGVMRAVHVSLGCLLAAVLLAMGPAPAFAGTSGDLGEARRHLERAQALIQRKHLREAIVEYDLAFEWSGQPNMLYNIGEVYRALALAPGARSDDGRRAVEHLRRFLAMRPEDPERPRIQRWIAALEARAGTSSARESPLSSPPPPPPPVPPPSLLPSRSPLPPAMAAAAPPVVAAAAHHPSSWRLGGRIVLGAGVALGLAAVGFGGWAITQDGMPACHLMAPATQCQRLIDATPTGISLVVTGTVIALASTVGLAAVEVRARARPTTTVTLAPALSPSTAALVVAARW